MNRAFFLTATVCSPIVLAAAYFWLTGLPMRSVPPPQTPVGAIGDHATDPARREFFAGSGARIIPFQILYPASAPGRTVAYVPDAAPVKAGLERLHGRLTALALRRLGSITAPWTEGAAPGIGGPYPVILALPGVTGYMQMSSFQTAPLAAAGFIVVTLDQPGSVAAARLPNGRVVPGMSRDDAARFVAPSYRRQAIAPSSKPNPAASQSIVPYLAADVPLVLARLSAIDADPRHPLHGLLDLQRVGIMGVSLGAIVAAQACHRYAIIKACLMLDAPVPGVVADAGLRQPALWLTRPAADQRAERAVSGGWPEAEIAAQADSVTRAVANSDHARAEIIRGLFHIDFTDVPVVQPLFGRIGLAGPAGTSRAHRRIVQSTIDFFRQLKADGGATPPSHSQGSATRQTATES